jgi:hypothetical protein
MLEETRGPEAPSQHMLLGQGIGDSKTPQAACVCWTLQSVSGVGCVCVGGGTYEAGWEPLAPDAIMTLLQSGRCMSTHCSPQHVGQPSTTSAVVQGTHSGDARAHRAEQRARQLRHVT